MTLEASSFEHLFIDFLSKVITLSAVYHEQYDLCTVERFTEKELAIWIIGCKQTYGSGVEIKAVTYHDFVVEYKHNQWQATITFDI